MRQYPEDCTYVFTEIIQCNFSLEVNKEQEGCDPLWAHLMQGVGGQEVPDHLVEILSTVYSLIQVHQEANPQLGHLR